MKNGRCRVHGGASTGAPKGNSNRTTHGFYTNALLPEERAIWARVEIGSVDDEIRLMRVKLHRLVKLSGSAEVAELIDSALEVTRKQGEHPEFGPFDRNEIKVKVPQYSDLILQAVSEIRKLESERMQIRLAEKAINEGGAGGNDEIVGFEVVTYDENDTPVAR